MTVSLHKHEAEKLDERVKTIIGQFRSSALELGALLAKVRDKRLYRELGFKWFKDYVAARSISMSYAERVIRAHRYSKSNPALAELSVEQVLFVVNVSSRENSGRSIKEWADFARTSSVDERLREKKRLTRKGVLPKLPIGREQAIKNAPKEVAIDMTIRVTDRARKLFNEQCETWGLSTGGTLLKLLLIAQSASREALEEADKERERFE